jgi:hypothetical protein
MLDIVFLLSYHLSISDEEKYKIPNILSFLMVVAYYMK